MSDSVSRILSPEELSDAQRDIVTRTIAAAQTGGVLTGVLHGGAEWDLRPLILEHGVLTVIRSSDPELAFLQQQYSELRRTFRILIQAGQALQSGEREGQLWLRRRYFSSTLLQKREEERLPEGDVGRFLAQLLRVYRHYLQFEIVHGHIHLGNVAYENDTLYLLDAGFCYHTPSKRFSSSNLAPELGKNVLSGAAADIFGLGLVSKEVCHPYLPSTDPRRTCFESMLHEDPSRRPSFEWVENVFMHGDQAKGGGRGEGVAGGRLVERTSGAVQIPTPVETKEPPATPKAKSSSSGFSWIIGALIAVGVVLYVRDRGDQGSQNEADLPVEAYWSSGQPSFMKEVAEAAVDRGDAQARFVIVDAAMRGKSYPFVRADLIRLAFDPRWDNALTDEDRRVVLKISLGALLPRSALGFTLAPPLHPGVVLALLASMDINSAGAQLSRFPVDYLSSLPAPIGPSFQALAQLKYQSVEVPESRALAHLLTGDIRPQVLDAYLKQGEEVGLVLAKLEALKGLLAENQKLGDVLADHLEKGGGIGKDLMGWFTHDELGLWKEVPKKVRLFISLGVLPPKTLSFEQYVDLVRFPRQSVRKEALQALGDENQKLVSVATYLAGNDHSLGRTQVIGLMSALKAKGEAAFTFVSRWFKTNPDPAAVAAVLIMRADNQEDLDPFSVEAARYLMARIEEVPLDLPRVRKLLVHKEPLARAFAYMKLDPKKPDERQILQDMSVIEPNARMRKEITDRLKQ